MSLKELVVGNRLQKAEADQKYDGDFDSECHLKLADDKGGSCNTGDIGDGADCFTDYQSLAHSHPGVTDLRRF